MCGSLASCVASVKFGAHLGAARDEYRLAELNLTRVKLQKLPTADLVGTTTRTYEDGQKHRTDETIVGVQLTVPFPYDVEQHGEMQAARAQRLEKLAHYTEVSRQLEGDVVIQWSSYATAKTRSLASKTQSKSALVALEAISGSFVAGDRSIRDVLDQKDAYAGAVLSDISAVMDERLAVIELDRLARGVDTEGDQSWELVGIGR